MEDEYQLPHCPAFKEIGEHFDGFDLAVRYSASLGLRADDEGMLFR